MTVSIDYTLWVCDLHLPDNVTLRSPLQFPQVFTVQGGSQVLSSIFIKEAKKHIMEKGAYLELLKQNLPQDYKACSTQVNLKPVLGYYAECGLTFDYFSFSVGKQYRLAYIPSLGIQAVGKNMESLEQGVQAAVRLEFMRSERYKDVPAILETQWYESLQLSSYPLKFDVYSSSELLDRRSKPSQSILPQCAKRMTGKGSGTFGLEEACQQVARSLGGKFTRSVLLKGPVGSGKTALVGHIAANKRYYQLEKLEIWQTTAARLIQCLTVGSGWQKNLALLCQELAERGDILYVKNLAELFHVGQYEGNQVSMGDYFKEYLGRGDITMISESTLEQAAKIELASPGYLSHFNIIELSGEHSAQQEEIVHAKVKHLANKAKIEVDEGARKVLLELVKKYTPYSGMPGKAIRFMEELILSRDEQQGHIGINEVYEQFCEETGMLRSIIDPSEKLDLDYLEQYFRQRVYGQDPAVNICINLLARIKAGLAKPGKPIASLLFVGPTGVGKTEMAKTMASYMFGSSHRMIRFDMSEYADLANVLRLTGDTSAEGLLTSKLRQQPFSVVLFDELEKADESFYDFLLQILGEGRLTDREGRTANFTSSIVIMTSNIGAESHGSNQMGFAPQDSSQVGKHFEQEVQKHFRPELFNRLDEIIAFEALSSDIIANLVHREVDELLQRPGLSQRHTEVEIKQEIYSHLAKQGYNAKYGARFLKRSLQNELVIPLAKKMVAIKRKQALQLHIGQHGSALQIDVKPMQVKDIGEQIIEDGLAVGAWVERLSDQRRLLVQLMENPHYLELCSKIDILNNRIKSRSPDLWQDEEASKQYHRYTKLQNTFLQLKQHIEKLENQGLAYLFKRHEELDTHSYETWAKQLFEAKLDLYNELVEDAHICSLALLGNYKTAKLALKVYQALLGKEYKLEVLTVCFGTEHYVIEKFSPTDTYQYSPVGLMLKITGPQAYLLLQGENGVHVWLKGATENKLFIRASNEYPNIHDPDIPEKVHRSSFFKSLKGRRSYSSLNLKDKIYAINEETSQAVKILQQVLQLEMARRLDDVLIHNFLYDFFEYES